MVPTTFLSLHDISRVEARVEATFSHPLILHIEGPRGTSTSIALFLDDEETAQRLANAINDAVNPPQPPAMARPHETAAYTAAHHAYRREDR
jgi:hypothetical protein